MWITAPTGMALPAIRKTIMETPGVAAVHDLHVWVSGADQPNCSAHVVLAETADSDSVRRALATRLEADFDVHHVTIQIERAPCDQREELDP